MSLLLSVLLLSSSLSWAQTPGTPLAVELLEQGTDPRNAVTDYQFSPLWARSGCQVTSWTLNGTDPAGQFKSLAIRIKKARPVPETKGTPTVVILPPTGGGTILDDRLMKIFCESGIRTLLLEGWTGDLEQELDPSTHDRGSLRGVAAVRQTLSFFGIERAGIYGTSLGGIIASTAAGVDPRLDAMVTTVAGGNVLETLAGSDQEILVRLRNERMKKYNLATREEYREFLSRAITINASDWTRPEISARTWMVIATEDTTVPTPVQIELWQHWGKPKRTDIASGHLGTVVWTELTYAGEIAQFFLEKLRN